MPGVRKVLVASGIRMDLARRRPEYMRELAAHHVGGHLKVAPEHTDPDVLELMKKPGNDDFEEFAAAVQGRVQGGGQEAVPRPVLHRQPPRQRLDAMIDLAVFLKHNGYRPDQVQDFIPAPVRRRDVHVLHRASTRSPKKPVYIATAPPRPQAAARADAVLQAGELLRGARGAARAGRADLIGDGCDSLIPASRRARPSRRGRRRASSTRRRRAPTSTRAATTTRPRRRRRSAIARAARPPAAAHKPGSHEYGSRCRALGGYRSHGDIRLV